MMKDDVGYFVDHIGDTGQSPPQGYKGHNTERRIEIYENGEIYMIVGERLHGRSKSLRGQF